MRLRCLHLFSWGTCPIVRKVIVHYAAIQVRAYLRWAQAESGELFDRKQVNLDIRLCLAVPCRKCSFPAVVCRGRRGHW